MGQNFGDTLFRFVQDISWDFGGGFFLTFEVQIKIDKRVVSLKHWIKVGRKSVHLRIEWKAELIEPPIATLPKCFRPILWDSCFLEVLFLQLGSGNTAELFNNSISSLIH